MSLYIIAETRAKNMIEVLFRTKTYVGDAAWDVEAAANLKYNFIGVGSGTRSELLRDMGASQIVPDLNQAGAFLQILDEIWDAKPANSPDSG
jgi:phosphoglycolate phosphatase-like HAD superfamily hydrolase